MSARTTFTLQFKGHRFTAQLKSGRDAEAFRALIQSAQELEVLALAAGRVVRRVQVQLTPAQKASHAPGWVAAMGEVFAWLGGKRVQASLHAEACPCFALDDNPDARPGPELECACGVEGGPVTLAAPPPTNSPATHRCKVCGALWWQGIVDNGVERFPSWSHFAPRSADLAATTWRWRSRSSSFLPPLPRAAPRERPEPDGEGAR
jgi:hypothetical protein